MKSHCFKFIQFAVFALLSINMMACDNARFGADAQYKSTDGTNTLDANLEDFTFIDDSFESTDLYMDLANSIIYGWRGFIDDAGTNVFGFEGNNTGMKTFDQAQLGPVFDGNRALWFYGREGADIQTMYLVSQAYDLSNFNSVILNFRYLTVALNDATDSVPEYLRVQVCRAADLNLCGANADALNANALKSETYWTTIYEVVPGSEDDGFNGKNHSVNNWQTALAVVDLNDESMVGDKSQFVFRIVARMRDGFTPGAVIPGKETCKCDCDKKHKDCKHKDCKNKKCDHKNCNKKDCKKNNCKCDCKKSEDVVMPADGTLKDGIAIDRIMGIATQRSIADIF